METKVDKRTKEYKDSVEPRPVADLLHCPRCGSELLEDERNSKSPAHCRQCVWRNA